MWPQLSVWGFNRRTSWCWHTGWNTFPGVKWHSSASRQVSRHSGRWDNLWSDQATKHQTVIPSVVHLYYVHPLLQQWRDLENFLKSNLQVKVSQIENILLSRHHHSHNCGLHQLSCQVLEDKIASPTCQMSHTARSTTSIFSRLAPSLFQ